MGDEIQPVAENENVEPETKALVINDFGADDTARLLSDINLRLERMESTVDGLRSGVNTIGEMMNSVAEMFGDMVNKVNNGGIGALLGNLMGRNNG